MEWKYWVWLVLVAFLLGGLCECEGCWDQEKTALVQLKPFFPHIDEGKQSSSCCEWQRVECNTSTGRVIRLFLNRTTTDAWQDLVERSESERHKWYLNVSLFLPFDELKSLYLSENSFVGCVDNQGFERLSSKLNKLEILDLSANLFNDSILASLSELSSLKSLYLGDNQFTGTNTTNGIKRLSKLNKLETLDLRGNILGNNILSHLHGFTSLKSLRLQMCGLNGIVDMLEFNNLMNLKELYLGENALESLGSLLQSKEQLRLKKLEVLDLSDNLFNNSIFSSLAALSNLKSLYIRGNNLKEAIHIQELNALMKLEVLDLSDNLFDNSIFSSLAGFSNLKSLYIDRNKLKGAIDIQELNALSNLVELDMSDNEVNDFVPSQDNEKELRLMNLEVLDLSENLFNNSILSSLGRLSNLKSLSLGGENLEGSIDLGGLYALTNLEELDMYCYSSIACSFPLQPLGKFPLLKTIFLEGFSFYGTLITQSPPPLKNLESLSIWSSSLENNFLQKIGAMPSLRNLDLSDCGLNAPLQGPLPLKNLESLSIWNSSLENNFFQNFGAMPSLKYLELSQCELSATLLTQGFCEMTNLQQLYISNNNLTSDLSECFSNFTSLEILDLSSNQFFGNISALKSLTSLEKLDLSNNNFEIPSSLGPLSNLSKLQEVNADNNTIYAEVELHSLTPTFQLELISLSCCGDVGPFPQFLYHQHDLRYVDLSNIKFTGEFPSWMLENNSNLDTLLLANNSLLGRFELTSHSHKNLAELDISQNSFHGNIPNEIGAKLPSLLSLNMSNNYFGSNIPVSIGDMNSLNILDLSNNKLIGEVPEHLAMDCSSLSVLILSNNSLQGQMFSSNFSLTNLRELKLDRNYFSGRIPDCLSNCSFLSTLDVSRNQLFGDIPRWMENISSLSTLDISNNEIFGDIPRWMGNMLSLEEIVMANNHLEGSIPMEFCQLNLKLKLLDLSVNNISGSLPSCFSPLWISQVHLSRNKLQGPLTNAFRNSTILMTLDLSNNHINGSIPNWIGRLSQLSYLLLNNNHFEGRIPVQLCNLSHLSLIDLSNNNLSGTIPPCLKITTLNDISQDYVRYVAAVGQANSSFSTEEPIEFTNKNISYSYKGRVLTYLSGIDLSCNKLTGEIPPEVKNFKKIVVLNLSHNSLNGTIPPAISDLRQIESLDLSYNKLSGKIPSQLVALNFLVFFSVAYNNLSGSTPDRTAQFALFEESSYLGNHFLCGAPLPKCSPDGPSSSPILKASTDNGSIDMNVFYVSFVVSYIMMLLGIASVLYINPYWRQAWFYYIEVGITSCYYFVVDNLLPKRFR